MTGVRWDAADRAAAYEYVERIRPAAERRDEPGSLDTARGLVVGAIVGAGLWSVFLAGVWLVTS